METISILKMHARDGSPLRVYYHNGGSAVAEYDCNGKYLFINNDGDLLGRSTLDEFESFCRQAVARA